MNKKMFSLFHVEFLIDIQASILTTLGQSSLVNRPEATRLDSTTESNQVLWNCEQIRFLQ
jgi:hypothetical protein